jgi:hypothetical protein
MDAQTLKMTPHPPSYVGHPLPKKEKGEPSERFGKTLSAAA